MLINVIAAVYLIVHSLIHLIGFVVFWQIAEFEDISYTTTVLAGKLDVGHRGRHSTRAKIQDLFVPRRRR